MQTMTLVGQMDSPFVRRVAVTMSTYGLPYRLNPLSVYGDFDALRLINPMGTVPVVIDTAATVRTDTEAICAWLDGQASTPMPRPTPACWQLIGAANFLAQKAGERYRLHRWPSAGEGFAKLTERSQAQIQAGLDVVAVGLVDRTRQGLAFGHADIAAVCAVRFAQQIGSILGKEWGWPYALTTELAFRETTPGFSSTSVE